MIRVAVVGAGGMGKTHIRNIQEIAGATITDLCDPAPASEALATELGARWHAALDSMLRASDADVVLVATPTFLHFKQVGEVLRAGKHCISEKPLCLSAEKGTALLSLARAQGVQLYVAQVLRFWEEYEILARLIREKPHGEVRDLYFYRLTQRPAWSVGGWMFEKEKSGLIPFDLHVHDLDFLVSVCGKPEKFAVQRGGSSAVAFPEYYRVMYDYGPVTACVESSWYNAPIPFTQGYRAYFEQAVLLFEQGRVILCENEKQPVTLYERTGGVDTHINVSPTTAFRDELAHFFQCVAENRPSPRVPNDEVLLVLDILEQLGNG